MKIAIIGTVPYSKNIAPYEDPTWDIWVCAPGNSQAGAPPRITAWYELHAMVDMKGLENRAWYPAYHAWLNAHAAQFTIWMQEAHGGGEVVGAKAFPRKAILDKYGPKALGVNWFTSSPAWMIAHALMIMQAQPGGIVKGRDEIGIWGVDMAATEEHYSWQKAGILRFFEEAHRLGVKITVPLESTLAFGFPMYGYAESSRMGRALIIREFELQDNLNRLQADINRLQHEHSGMRGQLEQVKFDRRTFVSGYQDAEIDEAQQEDLLPPTGLDANARASLMAAAASGSPEAAATFQEAQSGLMVPPGPPPAGSTKPPSAADFPDNPHAALLRKGKRDKSLNGPSAQTE